MAADQPKTKAKQHQQASSSKGGGRSRLSFFGMLAFKIPMVFVLMLGFMIVAFLGVMENYGKPLLLQQAKQELQQSGESIVSVLGERLALTASLVSAMANSAEAMPADDQLHHDVIRRLVNYEGTEHFIAGGGVWPEPKLYDPAITRRSFFWGRDQDNLLQYFDDYNLASGNGYHNEEWYVPAKYVKPGEVYWSRSYMDPYSYQSMVTATAPMYRGEQFYGVATVDIKLEGLTELLANESHRFEGYAYALDRNGTFLSFPDADISQRIVSMENGQAEVEYLNIEEVSKQYTHIPNILSAIDGLERISKLNKTLMKTANAIARDSYQIDLAEAYRIISIISDPFKNKSFGGTFIKEIEMPNDPILNTPVIINVFHVPSTYWKVVTVTPQHVVSRNSENITKAVLTSFLYVLLFGLLIGLAGMYGWFILPIQKMRHQLVNQGNEYKRIEGIHGGELGQLADKFNERSQQLESVNRTLEKSVSDAEQAVKAKTQFLANMSHEIRTPMNGVMGMLNLLMRGQLNPQQEHYAQVAKSSADGLLVLINDILDFSKIEAGKLDLEEIEFDIHAMLADFSAAMGHLADKKQLEFILDIQELHHNWVIGDPGRLRQVFTNLVSNAIKFTDEGEVVVRVGLRDAAEMGLILYASVSDTGIGISKVKHRMLFDSFSQVDASTTRQYGGTGLGLAICKQLVELMDGSISVVSDLGQGSRFEFSVNLKRSSRTQLRSVHIDLNDRHILIVDDNQTNCLLLKELLKSWGAQVSVCTSGAETLILLDNGQAHEYDAAILDMQMPNMDGEQLGRKIRANKDWDHVALVMMTSTGRRGDAKFFADLGFSAYLPKPVLPQDVHDALLIAIEGGEVLEQAQPLITHHHLETLRGLDAKQSGELNNGPARILLVEDNIINQEVALGLLEELGYGADVAENGREAIMALINNQQDHPYDVILMDCQMPILDGYETTREIRHGEEFEFNRDIPIIAMTANAMKGDKEKCLASGMDDYMSKPINLQLLKEKLEQWLPQDKA